jgi:hypothetical protein
MEGNDAAVAADGGGEVASFRTNRRRNTDKMT